MSGEKRQECEEVKVGSVTVQIRHSPVTVTVNGHSKPGEEQTDAAGPEDRTYDSWQIIFYEGSPRRMLRRNTPEKARKRAKEIAERLSRLGPQAGLISEEDRRVFVMARPTVKPLGLPVDEVCRRYAELQPEQAAAQQPWYAGGQARVSGGGLLWLPWVSSFICSGGAVLRVVGPGWRPTP